MRLLAAGMATGAHAMASARVCAAVLRTSLISSICSFDSEPLSLDFEGDMGIDYVGPAENKRIASAW